MRSSSLKSCSTITSFPISFPTLRVEDYALAHNWVLWIFTCNMRENPNRHGQRYVAISRATDCHQICLFLHCWRDFHNGQMITTPYFNFRKTKVYKDRSLVVTISTSYSTIHLINWHRFYLHESAIFSVACIPVWKYCCPSNRSKPKLSQRPRLRNF